ncbi:uncharacterized protein NESG_01768 [Nematocida ausubeli]|uniref:Uncharacterized protein n=1 Tax=Nematocida ausubeli (strain ATCC PRA-371 / ERTm2) TaxID=1913371 RepID=A0A086J0W6_NEMA1|nr:uncharacterized protein NESG_01768 [Nematocida ausubeli]KFG25784.1 hypothetical protein NESG_01768 [Nematocida ausubeli]
MISRLLLSLVIMQSILARINMKDIKTVSETLVGEKQDVVINPKGPLNLLRGYIGNRSGYMYNKRFYSSEIDTDYELSKEGISSTGRQEYKFTRTPVNDRVYKDLDTKTPDSKYLSIYHAQLIKMFPSIDGDLSIEAGRPNALTNFLRAENIKKDAKYILAALLLLSEGVDIKINVDHAGEKKRLVIKSKTCKEKVFVDVEMHTAGIDPVTNEHSESIYQSEAAGIIKFYMQCRDNPLLKRGGEFAMPATKEEFESGRFLNNAAFLIQTYIYEFIDTAENYVSFVNAVHELLVDQVAEKENPKQTKKKGKKGRIFDELFLAKDTLSENKKYIESFYGLVQAINENANFPFYNDSQLPRYTRVPRCKLDKLGFEKSHALYYSDCVETALLGLFCCLAYNQNTGEYQTSHMGEGVSKELRDFFEKYSKPKEATSFEMHKKWCRVVACLKNDRIDYKKAKNELISGVGNILLAIAEITGQKAETLELVEYIESADKAGKLNYKQEVYIADKIESIIRSLSLNKNVEVKCNQMTLGKRSSGKADILAQIVITYNFDGEKNGISLDISQGHATLSLFRSFGNSSAKVKEKCEEVKNTYSDVDCYVGYIADHYVSTELDALFFNKADFSKKLKKVLYPVIQEGSEGIYKIFLLEKLVSNEIKGLIINSFIDSTIDKEVLPANPLTRFTANILGSVPLNDPSTRYTMLKHFPLHASWQKFYPKLGFKPSENIPKEDAIWANIAKVYTYTTLANLPAPAALKAICNYIKATANNTRMEYSGVYCITRTHLFEHIVSKERVDRLVEIQSILKESTKDYNLNYVYLLWFIHVSSGVGGFSLESIKIVYDFILFDNYPKPLVFEEGISGPAEYFEKSLSVLKENKTLFCSKDDRKSIKKYNGLVSYLRKFIKTKKTGCFPMF